MILAPAAASFVSPKPGRFPAPDLKTAPTCWPASRRGVLVGLEDVAPTKLGAAAQDPMGRWKGSPGTSPLRIGWRDARHSSGVHGKEGCPAQLWHARDGKSFSSGKNPPQPPHCSSCTGGSCSGATCQDKKEFQGQFPAINEAFSPREAVLRGREPHCTAKEGKGGSYPSAPALEEAARRDPQCHGTCQEEVWDLPLPGPAGFPPSGV